jgi:hypothetical protein
VRRLIGEPSGVQLIVVADLLQFTSRGDHPELIAPLSMLIATDKG